MKKIVITGATSMIGTALTEVAVREGVEVYAIIRPNTARTNRIIDSPLVHVVYGTLDNLLMIDGLPCDCDVLYHFAWAGTKRIDRDNPVVQEANIKYTLDAVELACRCGCKRFIGAGSQAEYGPVHGVIDDNTKCAPVLSYGIAKYAAGILSRKACDAKGINHIWGRIFSVYGPHDNDETMLNYAISQFKNRRIAKFSSATQMWNYLFESDAGMIFYLLGEKEVSGSVYRVADSHSLPLRQYIREIARIMNAEELCTFESDDKQLVGIETCDKKLFDDINYRPQVGFTEGIIRMIEKRDAVL